MWGRTFLGQVVEVKSTCKSCFPRKELTMRLGYLSFYKFLRDRGVVVDSSTSENLILKFYKSNSGGKIFTDIHLL